MKQLIKVMILVLFAVPTSLQSSAQSAQKVNPPDDRYKVDILVVVAHPDDEAFFTPYLAKAIYDMHKRVAVIFSTHGGSGVNRFTEERGPAMANEREIEARDACARLGIKNVWFLDGKDTASQNVLNSLSNWGHGVNLERLVGLIRLTRPDIIFTHFPGVFIGENHGDHQATGVLSVEAFDFAANPTVFPSQLAGDMSHYESYLSNLQTWQPKKIYFGSDAVDSNQFNGSGPTYSVREVSPSQKKPYWRLAIDSAMAHRTQFPDDIDRLSKMSDAELEKMMSDPNSAWWGEPSTLIFGRSFYVSKATDDLFSNLDTGVVAGAVAPVVDGLAGKPKVVLGGPWGFYDEFRKWHHLENIHVVNPPEIAIKMGTTLSVPLTITHDATKPMDIQINVEAPQGYKITNGAGKLLLPAEAKTNLRIEIETPVLSEAELKNDKPQFLKVKFAGDGLQDQEILLNVLLRSRALPQ